MKTKKEDIKAVTKINKIFFETFKDTIPELKIYQDVKSKDGYGANVIYTSQITIPEWNEKKKRKAGLEGGTIRGMLWIASDINPNGITGKEDIGRTYTIHFELKGKRRVTQRRWEDGLFIKFYNYARDIQTIIDLFKEWNDGSFNEFMMDIENKEYDWKKVY